MRINNKLKLAAFAFLNCLAGQSLADTSLKIYGQGHLSYDRVDDGINTHSLVASSSSRLGVTMVHPISDSLEVLFQIESGVDLTGEGTNDGNGPSNSNGQIFTKGRPSFVGLRGNMGTVLIGHMPALDEWANDYNHFADQVGDLGNLWEASGIPGRLDDVIYYKTPDLAGATVAVTYAPDQSANDDDILIVNAEMGWDNFYLTTAYTQIGQGTVSNDDHTGLAVLLSYNVGGASIGVGYQSEQDIQGIAGNDRDSYTIGASYPIGKKGKIKAQYAISESDTADSDAEQFAIGYDYSLDANNVIYIAVAFMDNDNNVAFSVNGKGHGDKITPQVGEDMTAVSIGIVSKFDASLDKLLKL